LAPKDDFASLMEGTNQDPNARRVGRRAKVGETVEGTVVQIGRDWVFVDIGGTSEARIERHQLVDAKGNIKIEVGQRLRASVAQLGEEGPLLALSLGRSSRSGIDISTLKEAREAKLPVQGKVTKAVKAGVEVDVSGIRAFCPASQLDSAYVADLATFEGRSLDFLVTDIKDDGRSVVLSRRALLEEEKARAAKAVLERIAVGGEYEGQVSSLMKYGAFIDLGGGVEGLVHVSEMAHSRIDRVEDLLAPGDSVTVKVLAVEPQDKSPIPKLRLSIKALSKAPERPTIAVDEVLDATVSKVGSFGVRVTTAKGEGLVPLRELGIPRGSDHRKAFPVGKELQVVFVHRETSGKTTFSVSRVAAVQESANYREFTQSGQGKNEAPKEMGSFGALLRNRLGWTPPSSSEPQPSRTAALSEDVASERAPDVAFKDVMGGTGTAPSIDKNSNTETVRAEPPEGVFRRRR
jgi:small subunit ribosomal protein S1